MKTSDPTPAAKPDEAKPRRLAPFASDIGQTIATPRSSRRVFGWVISGLLISFGLYVVLNLSCDGPGAGNIPVQSDAPRR